MTLQIPNHLVLMSLFNQVENSNQKEYDLLLKAWKKLQYVMTTLCNQPELENSTVTFKLSDIVEQCITLAIIDLNME